jgi:hypothetical protein
MIIFVKNCIVKRWLIDVKADDQPGQTQQSVPTFTTEPGIRAYLRVRPLENWRKTLLPSAVGVGIDS